VKFKYIKDGQNKVSFFDGEKIIGISTGGIFSIKRKDIARKAMTNVDLIAMDDWPQDDKYNINKPQEYFNKPAQRAKKGRKAK
jgi:hypothetical protein